VLIVEDESYMADAIRDGLRLEAIAADIAGDGWIRSAARSTATSRSPGSSSPCSKCSSLPKAVSSAPKSY
jgi:hypothetical protein